MLESRVSESHRGVQGGETKTCRKWPKMTEAGWDPLAGPAGAPRDQFPSVETGEHRIPALASRRMPDSEWHGHSRIDGMSHCGVCEHFFAPGFSSFFAVSKLISLIPTCEYAPSAHARLSKL
jgi:hypothetical protein